MSNVLPFGGTKRATADVQFGNLRVPKETLFKTLMTELHMGDQWNQPEVFKPERFLDEFGQLVKSEFFIPFEFGKRSCLADTLAKSEMFLFLARLVQEFNIMPPLDGALPSLDYVMGLTLAPAPFKVRIQPRLNS